MIPEPTKLNTVEGKVTLVWRWWRLDHKRIKKVDRADLNHQAFIYAANNVHGGQREGGLGADFDGTEYVGWWRAEHEV